MKRISIVGGANMVRKSFLDKSIDEKKFHSTIIPWLQAYSHGTSCERLFRNIAKREYVDKNIWSYNIAIIRALICLIKMSTTVQCSDINFTFSAMWRQKNLSLTCCNVIIFRIHA